MLRTLSRSAACGQLVRIVYLDRRGSLSERVIRVYAVEGERVKAYCFSRRGWRVFSVSNILAAMPVAARTGTGDENEPVLNFPLRRRNPGARKK